MFRFAKRCEKTFSGGKKLTRHVHADVKIHCRKSFGGNCFDAFANYDNLCCFQEFQLFHMRSDDHRNSARGANAITDMPITTIHTSTTGADARKGQNIYTENKRCPNNCTGSNARTRGHLLFETSSFRRTSGSSFSAVSISIFAIRHSLG